MTRDLCNNKVMKRYYKNYFLPADNQLKKISSEEFDTFVPLRNGQGLVFDNAKIDPNTLEIYIKYEDNEISNIPIIMENIEHIRPSALDKALDGLVILHYNNNYVPYRYLHLVYSTIINPEEQKRGYTFMLKDINKGYRMENLIIERSKDLRKHYTGSYNSKLTKDEYFFTFDLAMKQIPKSEISKRFQHKYKRYISPKRFYSVVYPNHPGYDSKARYYLHKFLEEREISYDEYLERCNFEKVEDLGVEKANVYRGNVFQNNHDRIEVLLDDLFHYLNNPRLNYKDKNRMHLRYKSILNGDKKVRDKFFKVIENLINEDPKYKQLSIILDEELRHSFFKLPVNLFDALIDVYNNRIHIDEVVEKYDIVNINNFKNYILPTKARKFSDRKRRVFSLLVFLMEKYDLKLDWPSGMILSIKVEHPDLCERLKNIIGKEEIDYRIKKRNYGPEFNVRRHRFRKSNLDDRLKERDVVDLVLGYSIRSLLVSQEHRTKIEQIFKDPNLLEKMRYLIEERDLSFLYNIFYLDYDLYTKIGYFDIHCQMYINNNLEDILNNIPKKGTIRKYNKFHLLDLERPTLNLTQLNKELLLYQLLSGNEIYSKEKLHFLNKVYTQSLLVKKSRLTNRLILIISALLERDN